MKLIVALLLFITPWIIFLLAANYMGSTSTFVLLLTLAVSAFGFMLLIGGGKNGGDKK